MKILFLFLYLLRDQPVLETDFFDDLESCQAQGYERVERRMAHPQVLFAFAGCTPVQAQSVEADPKGPKKDPK